MIQITDSNFFSTLEQNKFVIVRFTAPWCGPCRTLKPIFAELEEKWKDKIVFAEINVDECPETTDRFMITSIPKTFIFQDALTVDMISGPKTKAVYDNAIANAVG